MKRPTGSAGQKWRSRRRGEEGLPARIGHAGGLEGRHLREDRDGGPQHRQGARAAPVPSPSRSSARAGVESQLVQGEAMAGLGGQVSRDQVGAGRREALRGDEGGGADDEAVEDDRQPLRSGAEDRPGQQRDLEAAESGKVSTGSPPLSGSAASARSTTEIFARTPRRRALCPACRRAPARRPAARRAGRRPPSCS